MAEPQAILDKLLQIVPSGTAIAEGVKVLANPADFVKGVLVGNSVDLAGAPVDLINSAISPITKPLGIYTDNPTGGSKQLRGMLGISPAEADSAAQTAGSFVSPAGIAKASMLVGAKVVGKLDKVMEATRADSLSWPSLPGITQGLDSTVPPNVTLLVPAERKLTPEVLEKAQFLSSQTKVNNASLYRLTGAYMDGDGVLKASLTAPLETFNRSKFESGAGTVGNLFPSKEFAKTLPEIQGTRVTPTKSSGTSKGSYTRGYDGRPGRITLTAEDKAGDVANEQLVSALAHETGHNVQDIFKWSQGGNAASFLNFAPDKVQEGIIKGYKSADKSVQDAAVRFKDASNRKLEEAHTKYLNLPGEQEATFLQHIIGLDEIAVGQHLLDTLKQGKTPQSWNLKAPPVKPKKP